MTKKFKEELEDLIMGLSRLEKMNPKTHSDVEKIRHAKEIQKARIQFFGRGYGLRCGELDSQKKIIDISVVETWRQACL